MATTVARRMSDGQVVRFPKLRRVLALMYASVQRAHKIHGLIEVDVTDARRMIHDVNAKTD